MAWAASDFLDHVGEKNYQPALILMQMLFNGMPGDPKFQQDPSTFDDRWRWIAAVAQRSYDDGALPDVAKIGLMTEIWNRVMLTQSPEVAEGRLRRAPEHLEFAIYGLALRALRSMDPSAVLFEDGDGGFRVSDATGQISRCIHDLAQDGASVSSELLDLTKEQNEPAESVAGTHRYRGMHSHQPRRVRLGAIARRTEPDDDDDEFDDMDLDDDADPVIDGDEAPDDGERTDTEDAAS